MAMKWLREHGGYLLLALGAVFLLLGVIRGEPGIILQKAIRVCLECIGIG